MAEKGVDSMVKAGVWQMFSEKGWIVNILSFVGPMLSAKTTQLCCWSMKTTETICKQMTIVVFQ